MSENIYPPQEEPCRNNYCDKCGQALPPENKIPEPKKSSCSGCKKTCRDPLTGKCKIVQITRKGIPPQAHQLYKHLCNSPSPKESPIQICEEKITNVCSAQLSQQKISKSTFGTAEDKNIVVYSPIVSQKISKSTYDSALEEKISRVCSATLPLPKNSRMTYDGTVQINEAKCSDATLEILGHFAEEECKRECEANCSGGELGSPKPITCRARKQIEKYTCKEGCTGQCKNIDYIFKRATMLPINVAKVECLRNCCPNNNEEEEIDQ